MRRLLIAILLVAGCATAKGYEAMLEGWLGASERELVAGWGVPDSIYEADGVRFLQYSDTEVYGSVDPGYFSVWGGGVYTGVGASRIYTRRCETTFTLEDGRVTAWRYDGGGCRA
ncbi:hypothetical protein M1105_07260 [Limibaculum sp. FT325]|uniref:hypothetical protein n=1 Tax=Thermohalobaculum sediminis TaxID=2939436 RepID=UPI0020BF072F|nr:hypothetical protein [Limibaculum sediminis]MCL5776783.1 hypothetical protein [Limibaculum sediminis]